MSACRAARPLVYVPPYVCTGLSSVVCDTARPLFLSHPHTVRDGNREGETTIIRTSCSNSTFGVFYDGLVRTCGALMCFTHYSPRVPAGPATLFWRATHTLIECVSTFATHQQPQACTHCQRLPGMVDAPLEQSPNTPPCSTQQTRITRLKRASKSLRQSRCALKHESSTSRRSHETFIIGVLAEGRRVPRPGHILASV